MKLVITGCGFVASHFLEYFHRETDWQIEALERELPKDADYIIHLSERSDIDESINNPAGFAARNFAKTINILEYARRLPNLKRLIYFSTEDKPENPYAASKAAGEALCMAWQNTFKVPAIITRCGNLIGERQPQKKFLPTLVRAALKGEIVKLYTDPVTRLFASRDFFHAQDAASAVRFLLEHGEVGEKYDIARDHSISVLQILKEVEALLKKPIRYEFVPANTVRPGFSLRYGMDGSKLKALGWSPPKTFDERLEQTVSWLKANL
jgi:dTDP-D-glucose 4,6-dehydratase